MKPPTIGEMLKSRNDCRHGLKDLRVRVPGQEGEYKVWSTRWDRDGRLVATVYPAAGQGPIAVKPDPLDPPRLVANLADIARTEMPAGTLRHIPADPMILLDPWPHVCC